MQAIRRSLGPPGDIRRFGAFAVAGATGVVGGALIVRQNHLRSCPVVDAASEQIKRSDAVRELLGSSVASVGGFVGGYADPLLGTAAITIPLVSEGGVRAIARAEAEAEWVVVEAEAAARGEPVSDTQKSPNCRWLIRHLEVERVDLPPDRTHHKADANALTLYSVPAHLPLSGWAPSREPSSLPHWLRALLPNPAAVRQEESVPRLATAAAAAVLMHFVAFLALKRRMMGERAIRRAESLLALKSTPALDAMRDAALSAAKRAAGTVERGPMKQQPGALLYGRATADEVCAHLLCSSCLHAG